MQTVHVNILKRQLNVVAYYYRKYAKCRRIQLRREVNGQSPRRGLVQAMRWFRRRMRQRLRRYRGIIERLKRLYFSGPAKQYLRRVINRLEEGLVSLRDHQERWEERIRERRAHA